MRSITSQSSASPLSNSPSYTEVASLFRNSRNTEFSTGVAISRSTATSTQVHNPAIPAARGPKGGIDITRHMEGMGTFVVDPLANFKMESINLNPQSKGTRQYSGGQRYDTSFRYRRKATTAYDKANRQVK